MAQNQEEIFAAGKLFELVHLLQPDGRVFEVARRAPGVRLIIPNIQEQTVLLTREFRKELNGWDYRLPGGKVFDSLSEFEEFRKSKQDISVPATKKAKEEAREEAGIEVGELELFKKSVLGATVEWDLYVFEAKSWKASVDGQQLESGEEIEADTWMTFDDVERAVLNGKMLEERIALILLQWINAQRGKDNEV